MDETKNCPRTNVVSERDFAQFDRRLSAKPSMSTLAAAGVIMFNNNKTSDWLEGKSDEDFKTIEELAMKNRKATIQSDTEQRRKI